MDNNVWNRSTDLIFIPPLQLQNGYYIYITMSTLKSLNNKTLQHLASRLLPLVSLFVLLLIM